MHNNYKRMIKMPFKIALYLECHTTEHNFPKYLMQTTNTHAFLTLSVFFFLSRLLLLLFAFWNGSAVVHIAACICLSMYLWVSLSIHHTPNFPISLLPTVGALYIKGERGKARLRKYTLSSPGGKACEFFMRLTWFPAAPSPPVSHFPSRHLCFSMSVC